MCTFANFVEKIANFICIHRKFDPKLFKSTDFMKIVMFDPKFFVAWLMNFAKTPNLWRGS